MDRCRQIYNYSVFLQNFYSMTQKLLLAVVFLIIGIYSCPANYQIPNIQAGSAMFEVSQKTSYVISSTYDHQFLISFSSIPSIAYSIHNMVLNGPLTYQWAIKTNHITTNKLTIRFKYQPLQWTFVKCGFLVTERKDIILGAITSNFESLKQNSHIVTIDFNQTITNFNSSVMRVFMSGFTMKSGNQYYIRAFDKSISQKKVQIGVQVAGTMQITSIQLNYIIFNPRLSNFASYGGGQNQIQLNQSKMYNIERNIYYSPYKYYGVGHIRHSGQHLLAFMTEIDDNFYLRLDSLRPVQQIYIAYIILGVTPAQFCSNCNQLSCVNQRACVNDCPFDSYLVRYQDGGKGCRRCPTQYNMILNSAKNGCDCMNGYVKKRGHCVDGTSSNPVVYMSPLMQKLMKIINQIQIGTVQSSFGETDPFQYSNTLTQIQQTNTKTANIVLPQQIPSHYNIVNNNIGGNLQSQTILNSERTNNVIRLPQIIEITDKNRIVQTNSNLQESSRIVNFNANKQNYVPIPLPSPPIQNNVNQYGTNYSPYATVSINNIQTSYASAQQIQTQAAPKLSTIVTNSPSQVVQYSSPVITNKNQNTYGNQSHIINSYSPVIPSQQYYALPHQQQQQQQQTVIISQPQRELVYTQKDCTLFPNTYWSGYRCACKVGFSLVGSVCSPIIRVIPSALNRPAQFTKKLSALITNSQRSNSLKSCKQPNEIFNGSACICVSGCIRNERGICIRSQQNQYRKPIQREQREQKRHEDKDKKQNFIQCNQYSYRNSSGHCACFQGYIYQNGNCILEVPKIKCGPNSYQDQSGRCVCEKGYHLYDGKLCLLCPSGSVVIEGTCQHICGTNQISKLSKCICKENYCRLNGVCQHCPSDYFNIDGYCVTCPFRKVYNPQTNQCECQKGYVLKKGVCEKICTEVFQQYCEQTKKCVCIAGLSRIQNKCGICQSGVINPLTQQCLNDCQTNQIRIGNRCVCKPEHGYGPNKACIKCSDLSGGFLIDGHCAVCPENLININGKCGCPHDKKLLDNRCVNLCSSNQIIDPIGFCYVCPVNQQVINNRCVCKNGYERVNSICVTKCPPNSIQINGICAYCAMNTQYCPIRKVCVCPDNYYVNNEGLCQQFVPSPIQCPQSQFYCLETKKCQPCGRGCKFCEKQDTCRRCLEQGYYPSGSMCIPKCGDGLKLQIENCDDGNSNNYDGCSQSCEIEPHYACIGTKPSKCTKFKGVCGDGTLTQDQQCDDKNINRGDGCYNCLVEDGWQCISNFCSRIPHQNNPIVKPPQIEQPPSQQSAPSIGVNLKQVGDAIINTSNVFVILECPTAFKFASEKQMKSFMKYRFLDSKTEPKSAYCVQRASNQKLFDCLNIYPSGLPNKVYKVVYSYDYQGETGQVTVQINPLKNGLKSRSSK